MQNLNVLSIFKDDRTEVLRFCWLKKTNHLDLDALSISLAYQKWPIIRIIVILASSETDVGDNARWVHLPINELIISTQWWQLSRAGITSFLPGRKRVLCCKHWIMTVMSFRRNRSAVLCTLVSRCDSHVISARLLSIWFFFFYHGFF